jgi:hypothetical protein
MQANEKVARTVVIAIAASRHATPERVEVRLDYLPGSHGVGG